ncbi:hypothetical protein ACEWY4_022849 [Coilia grayii]|uniref:Ig-like domain-containing protein n=1 Tax=Coilia grayii TaxID=363190 RepID=A0ABD1J1B1_9TELE
MMLFITFMLVVKAVSSGENIKYGQRGGSIELQAKDVSMPVTSIVWKHGTNKAAEWFDGEEVPTYFRTFHGNSRINTSTWSLTILDLQPEFDGEYSAEVNNQNAKSSETLKVIGPVEEANVVSEDCNLAESENCTLSCNGKGDGPLEYSWTWSDGKSANPMLTVQKREDGMEYTCRVSNPVSSKEDTFSVPKRAESPSNLGVKVGVPVVLVVIVAVAAGLAWWKKKKGQGQGEVTTVYSQVAGRADGDDVHANNTGNGASNNIQGETGGGENTGNKPNPTADASAGNSTGDITKAETSGGGKGPSDP